MILLKNENIFISKKEVMKLELLNYLLENVSISIDDLADLYAISQRTAKNLMTELLEDIYTIDSSLDISLNGIVLSFGTDFESPAYLKVYKTMQLYYYENSIPFQLFVLLFNSKSISIYDLSEKLVVSQSYLYKLIKNLSEVFEIWEFDVQINIKAYKVSFTGDETEIRCLAYYVFSLVFNTLHTEFKPTVSNSALNFVNTIKFTTTTNKLITIVENIFTLRQQQLYYLVELNEEEANFVSLIKEICPRYALSSLDNNESSALLLWLTYIAPDIISTNEKKRIGEHLWESELGMAAIFKPFINALKAEFNCSKDVMFLLMWEYYARFIIYRFFKSWKYKNIVEIKRSKNEYIDQIATISQTHLENHLPTQLTKQYIDELSELAYSYLDLLIPVKIHIDLFEYSSIRMFIENILRQSYGKKALIFTDNPYEADLIVTNVIPSETQHSDFFFFSDINSRVNWEELGKAIQRQLLKLNWSTPHN